jgi:hypothetical protein
MLIEFVGGPYDQRRMTLVEPCEEILFPGSPPARYQRVGGEDVVLYIYQAEEV